MRLLSFSLITVLTSSAVVGNELYKVCYPVSLAMDVLFLLDGSGSVSGNTFDMQMNMLRKVVELMRPAQNKSRLAVMQYAGYTRLEMPFAENRTEEEVFKALTRVKYMSGSTKTGKALKKARELFKEERKRKDVKIVHQVAIVVSDGHSHDDPMKAAAALRSDGVSVVVLGIGHHINRNELLQITEDEELAFQDLNKAKNLILFEEKFAKISTRLRCDYFRGGDGADIQCLDDRFVITVSTTERLEGALYVSGNFRNPNCVSKISREVQEPNSTYFDTMLTVLYADCGVHEAYMDSPQGQLFSSTVMLQFDPALSTQNDARFNIRCFRGIDDFNHRYLDESIFLPPSPCRYTVRPQGRCDGITVSDPLIHSWTCDYDDAVISVHSCEVMDPTTLQTYRLTDSNGCSISPFLASANHTGAAAISRGPAVRFPTSPLVIYRCGLRICRGEGCKSQTESCRPKRELRIAENAELTPLKDIDPDYPDAYDEIAVATASRNTGISDNPTMFSTITPSASHANPVGQAAVRPLAISESTIFPSFEVVLSTKSVAVIDKLESSDDIKEVFGRIATPPVIDEVLAGTVKPEESLDATPKVEARPELIVFGKSGDLERITPQTPSTTHSFPTLQSKELFPEFANPTPTITATSEEPEAPWHIVDVVVESEPLLIRLGNEVYTTSCPRSANK